MTREKRSEKSGDDRFFKNSPLAIGFTADHPADLDDFGVGVLEPTEGGMGVELLGFAKLLVDEPSVKAAVSKFRDNAEDGLTAGPDFASFHQ